MHFWLLFYFFAIRLVFYGRLFGCLQPNGQRWLWCIRKTHFKCISVESLPSSFWLSVTHRWFTSMRSVSYQTEGRPLREHKKKTRNEKYQNTQNIISNLIALVAWYSAFFGVQLFWCALRCGHSLFVSQTLMTSQRVTDFALCLDLWECCSPEWIECVIANFVFRILLRHS